MSVVLSKRIRAIRKLRGYSQSFIANKLGVTQKAYSKIECNETQLNWNKLNQIAEILGTNVWVLVNTKKGLSFTDQMNPNDTIDLAKKLIKQFEIKIRDLEKENKFLKNQLELKLAK